MANVLTSLRILCGLLILSCPAFSNRYYFLYLLGGFTDAVDGTVARRLGTETDFGAGLDTVSDFVFVSAVMIKLAGVVSVPTWLLLWLGVIAAIKISSVIVGAVRYRKFVTVHSVMNKVCGFAVFVSLLSVGWDCARQIKVAAALLTCTIATAAAIRECRLIYFGKFDGFSDETA